MFSDIIDVQRGAAIGGVTINIAIMHMPTYELVWGKPPAQPFSEPDCIVRTRLGFLMNGRDCWWQPGVQSDVTDMIEALSSVAIPFLAEFKNLADLERWLAASQNRYAPEVLYLVAAKYQCGDRTKAAELAAQILTRTTSEPWRERISAMTASLG